MSANNSKNNSPTKKDGTIRFHLTPEIMKELSDLCGVTIDYKLVEQAKANCEAKKKMEGEQCSYIIALGTPNAHRCEKMNATKVENPKDKTEHLFCPTCVKNKNKFCRTSPTKVEILV